MRPVELAGLRCGRCGFRRLGDDLTPAQMESLVGALAALFESEERRQVLRRWHGRKRPLLGS